MSGPSLLFSGPATGPVLLQRGPKIPLAQYPISALLILQEFTVGVVNGSAALVFSVPVTFPAGTQVQFDSQPDVTYSLAAAIMASTSGTLKGPYTGTSAGAAHMANVTPILTLQSGVDTTTDTEPVLVVAVSDRGGRMQLMASPAESPSTPANILMTQSLGVFACVGADQQPIQLTTIPANTVVTH